MVRGIDVAQVVSGRRGRCRFAPVVRLHAPRRGVVVQHEAARAEAGGLGHDQAEDGLHRDGRVGRAATSLQHGATRLARPRVRGHDHHRAGMLDRQADPVARCGFGRSRVACQVGPDGDFSTGDRHGPATSIDGPRCGGGFEGCRIRWRRGSRGGTHSRRRSRECRKKRGSTRGRRRSSKRGRRRSSKRSRRRHDRRSLRCVDRPGVPHAVIDDSMAIETANFAAPHIEAEIVGSDRRGADNGSADIGHIEIGPIDIDDLDILGPDIGADDVTGPPPEVIDPVRASCDPSRHRPGRQACAAASPPKCCLPSDARPSDGVHVQHA